jgi:hypothetical protein
MYPAKFFSGDVPLPQPSTDIEPEAVQCSSKQCPRYRRAYPPNRQQAYRWAKPADRALLANVSPGKHAQASELPLNLLITPLTRRSNHKSRRCAQLDSLDACRALDLSHPTFLHRRHERFPAGKLSGLGSLDSPRRVRGIGQRRSLTHARRLAKFLIGFVKRPPREKPSYRSRLRERTSSFPDIHMDFSVSAQGPIATPPIVKMGAPDTLHWMCCFGHLHCPGTNRTITEPAKLFSGHMLAPRISSEANHR